MLTLVLATSALQHGPRAAPPLNRRTAVSFGAGAVFSQLSPAQPALALKPCPPGAQNCWSTASSDKTKLAQWSWPTAMSRADAIKELKGVVSAYPADGQNGVDKGGFRIVDDELEEKGYERVEFLSGIGNMAKFFNGGKPFVDDFELSVEDTGVCVRSSSRVGDSDFGVNAKRINYIAAALESKGWKAKGVAL